MYKVFKIVVAISLFLSFVCVSLPLALAQGGYVNNYYGQTVEGEQKKEEELLRPVPKVFSSKLVSVDQGQKLDVLYNNLLTSLWVYASTDFVYQKKMYSLMAQERFKLTRHSKEFTGVLDDAMASLNKNYKSMLSDIGKAEQEYEIVKEGIKEEDYDTLEILWDEKISDFRKKVDQYFKMQNKYLNIYRNLVGFILKQNGGYYFDSYKNMVHFYKFGGYKFYGKSIDSLRRISFEQRELLRTVAPANTDIELR